MSLNKGLKEVENKVNCKVEKISDDKLKLDDFILKYDGHGYDLDGYRGDNIIVNEYFHSKNKLITWMKDKNLI